MLRPGRSGQTVLPHRRVDSMGRLAATATALSISPRDLITQAKPILGSRASRTTGKIVSASLPPETPIPVATPRCVWVKCCPEAMTGVYSSGPVRPPRSSTSGESDSIHDRGLPSRTQASKPKSPANVSARNHLVLGHGPHCRRAKKVREVWKAFRSDVWQLVRQHPRQERPSDISRCQRCEGRRRRRQRRLSPLLIRHSDGHARHVS